MKSSETSTVESIPIAETTLSPLRDNFQELSHFFDQKDISLVEKVRDRFVYLLNLSTKYNDRHKNVSDRFNESTDKKSNRETTGSEDGEFEESMILGAINLFKNEVEEIVQSTKSNDSHKDDSDRFNKSSAKKSNREKTGIEDGEFEKSILEAFAVLKNFSVSLPGELKKGNVEDSEAEEYLKKIVDDAKKEISESKILNKLYSSRD